MLQRDAQIDQLQPSQRITTLTRGLVGEGEADAGGGGRPQEGAAP
jgi:hypothetical protein